MRRRLLPLAQCPKVDGGNVGKEEKRKERNEKPRLPPWVGIQLCRNGSAIDYDGKFCDSVADLLVNFGQFW